MLFYALTLYLFVTKQVDTLYVDAAWVFVAFRVLHSAVHCTFNLVMLRFYLYRHRRGVVYRYSRSADVLGRLMPGLLPRADIAKFTRGSSSIHLV